MTIKPMVKPSEMRLADTIRHTPLGLAWNVCIVKQITDTHVVLFRPYGTTCDFSWSGGVICLIGVEEYRLDLTSRVEYELLERKELR